VTEQKGPLGCREKARSERPHHPLSVHTAKASPLFNDDLGLSARNRRAARQGLCLGCNPLEVASSHAGEEGKIHCRMRRPDGSTCHLIAHEGTAQCEVLEQHLAAIGYTGPKPRSTDELGLSGRGRFQRAGVG
jgi:hypothetical protein